MLEFLSLPGMQPFAVSMGLLLAILALEVVAAIIGAPWSSLAGDADTDFDLDVDADVDVDVGADIDTDIDAGAEIGGNEVATDVGPVAGLLSWLGLGRVPFLILLAGLLATFSASGSIVQLIANGIATTLPGWLASLIALPPTLFGTRWFAIGAARLLPREESAAVSVDSLIGSVAKVTVGTASSHLPAEARVRDRLGYTHYVRVRPEDPSATYPAGSRVVLVSRDGTVFTAVPMSRKPGELGA